MTDVPEFHTDACRQFVAHWRALPRRGAMPHCNDFMDAAPVTLMPYAMLYEMHDEGFLLRFVGTRLVEQWRQDRTGTMMAFDRRPILGEQFKHKTALLLDTPCGLLHVGAMQSSFAREIACETVSLPLAVDHGRSPRIVRCCILLEPLQRDEAVAGFVDATRRAWLDLGAGVPTETADLAP